MARIGEPVISKLTGQQLSLTGGIEVPMNRTVNDDIYRPGSVQWTARKLTVRLASKGPSGVPKNFPVSKITSV